MNSDIFSSSGGSMGLGFALASTDAKFLTDQLLKYGRVKAGWIGVDLQDLSTGIAISFREPAMQGSVVTAVAPGSPAIAAGIAEGNFIQRIDKVPLQDARFAERAFAYLRVDTTAHVTIWRNGHSVSLDVRSVDVPETETINNPVPLLNQFASGGLGLAPLTDEVRQEANMAPGQPDVLGTAVPGHVFTGKDILLPGDVVLRVQKTPVASPDDVDGGIARAKPRDRSASCY